MLSEDIAVPEAARFLRMRCDLSHGLLQVANQCPSLGRSHNKWAQMAEALVSWFRVKC